MSMANYMSVLNATYRTPKESIRDFQQAYVDTQWDSGTLDEMVLEEIERGSFLFEPIAVWKNSISEFTNNIIKNEKDFRRLMFQDQDHIVERGRFYRLEENYWIVYDPTSDIESYCEVYVRRCNNIAKWIDKDTNILHEIPCVLEYDFSSSQPQDNKDIITPNNSVVLALQGNKDTIKLRQNQRFVFNGRPFKITGFNNYMQDDYVTEDVSMLFFDIYLDEELPTDDLINNIANAFEHQYSINILENPVENVTGFQSKLTAQVMINNHTVDKAVTWSSNEYGEIDVNGNYTLIGEDGDIAVFTASYGNTNTSIEIAIVDSKIDFYEIVVSPDITNIKQNRTVLLDVNLYKNGIKQNDTVSVVSSGADSSTCYSLINQGNNIFALTNNFRSILPLNLKFNALGYEKNIVIELNSIF